MFSQNAFEISVAATTAYPSSSTGAQELLVGGQLALNLEIENQALTDMNGFKIQMKDHANGEWYDFITNTEIAAGVADNFLFLSGTLPSATPAGSKTHMHIRATACKFMRFLPKLASSTGTVMIRGSKISL